MACHKTFYFVFVQRHSCAYTVHARLMFWLYDVDTKTGSVIKHHGIESAHEWSTALAHAWADREKKLLPVVFGKSDPPLFLRNWVSFRIEPQSDTSTWTSEVVEALRSIPNNADARANSCGTPPED